MHCSAVTASHHFDSLHFQYERRAERGKESAVQWEHTHTPRVESEATAFSRCKEPEKKNKKKQNSLSSFYNRGGKMLNRSCSRTQQKFVPEIN